MVKLDGTFSSVLVVWGGDHGLDPKINNLFVNPIGPVSFIATECNGPSDGFSCTLQSARISSDKQSVQNR